MYIFANLKNNNMNVDMDDSENKLIDTECQLRKQQGEFGVTLIWGTCIICILVGLLPICSGAIFNNAAPEGTAAQIVLSQSYQHLIIFMSVPFIVGLTAGIVLIKSSVKHIAKSYFEAPVEDDEDSEDEDSD